MLRVLPLMLVGWMRLSHLGGWRLAFLIKLLVFVKGSADFVFQ